MDRDDKLVLGVLLASCLLLFFKLLVPYYQHSIYQWDAAGHAASSIFVKEELFPNMIGWNPNGYMGFPHNQFYSPLFSWIVGLLGFILGIEFAFKLVVSLSVLALPFGLYLLGRSFKLEKTVSLFFSSVCLVFLALQSIWFAQYTLGGNFESLFKTGLVANSLGLSLLLFYMAYLNRIYDKKYIIILSVLLAAIVLSSLVAGFAAIIYSISFFLVQIYHGKPKTQWVKHICLSFLLCAFWAIPFIAKSGYSISAFIPFNINARFIIGILACLLCLGWMYYKNKILDISAVAFISLMILSILLIKILGINFHSYRLVLFIYLFIILTLTKTFENLIGKLAIILAFALLIFALFSYCDYNLIDKKYETPVEVNIPGRSLIISTFNNGANVHFLEHLIPLWNRNTEGVSNIYIESALNGREINTLKRAIVSNGLVWGTTWNLGNIQKTSSFERDELIDRAAQLFGLSSIVTYAESSSINYLSKNELFNDKIKLAHRVYDIEDEKFYSQSGGFLISKKTGKVYLVDFGGVDYFEISDNVFNENNVLRDELLLCDNMSFYFLRKNPSLDFNSYSYTIKSLSEVRNIISYSKFECINGLKFPKINEDSYLGYSSFWKTKLINIKSIKRTDVNSSMAEEWNLRYYIYELNSSF